VSAAFGSTAAVTGAGNFGVALPVFRSTEAMWPAEVSASSSPDGARSRPTMRSPAARPVTLWMPDRPGDESLCSCTICPAEVTAVKPSAAWAAEGASSAAPRAAVVRRVREERDMPPQRERRPRGHAELSAR
jgi:hypothetical protein